MSSIIDIIRKKKKESLVVVNIFEQTLAVVPLSIGDRMSVISECVLMARNSVNEGLKASKLTKKQAQEELQNFINIYGFGDTITPEQIEQMYQVKVESEYELQLIRSSVFNFGKVQATEVLRKMENGQATTKIYNNAEERAVLIDYFGSGAEELQIVTNALSEKKAPTIPKRSSSKKSS